MDIPTVNKVMVCGSFHLDIGNRVLVMFVEGNINRAFWIGCVQQATMNFMLPDGRPATTITDTEDASPIGKKLPVGEHNKIRNAETTVTNPLNIKKAHQYFI